MVFLLCCEAIALQDKTGAVRGSLPETRLVKKTLKAKSLSPFVRVTKALKALYRRKWRTAVIWASTHWCKSMKSLNTLEKGGFDSASKRCSTTPLLKWKIITNIFKIQLPGGVFLTHGFCDSKSTFSDKLNPQDLKYTRRSHCSLCSSSLLLYSSWQILQHTVKWWTL